MSDLEQLPVTAIGRVKANGAALSGGPTPPQKLGYVWLESRSALTPWARQLARDAHAFVARRPRAVRSRGNQAPGRVGHVGGLAALEGSLSPRHRRVRPGNVTAAVKTKFEVHRCNRVPHIL
jgi:hypothetical protein